MMFDIEPTLIIMFWYFLIECFVALMSIRFYKKANRIAMSLTCYEQKTEILAKSKKYNLWAKILMSVLIILALIQVVDSFTTEKHGWKTRLLGQNTLNSFPEILVVINFMTIIACVITLICWIKWLNNYENTIDQRCREVKKHENKILELEGKYGKCGLKKCFSSDTSLLYDLYIRFDETRNLYADGIVIPYDCISYYGTSSNDIFVDKATTITKTKTGSAIGRGIVGGVVFGPIGALAGAATTKKESETVHEKRIVETKYKIVIYLKNYNKPTVTIDCGTSEKKAKVLSKMLDDIINEKI